MVTPEIKNRFKLSILKTCHISQMNGFVRIVTCPEFRRINFHDEHRRLPHFHKIDLKTPLVDTWQIPQACAQGQHLMLSLTGPDLKFQGLSLVFYQKIVCYMYWYIYFLKKINIRVHYNIFNNSKQSTFSPSVTILDDK